MTSFADGVDEQEILDSRHSLKNGNGNKKIMQMFLNICIK